MRHIVLSLALALAFSCEPVVQPEPLEDAGAAADAGVDAGSPSFGCRVDGDCLVLGSEGTCRRPDGIPSCGTCTADNEATVVSVDAAP